MSGLGWRMRSGAANRMRWTSCGRGPTHAARGMTLRRALRRAAPRSACRASTATHAHPRPHRGIRGAGRNRSWRRSVRTCPRGTRDETAGAAASVAGIPSSQAHTRNPGLTSTARSRCTKPPRASAVHIRCTRSTGRWPRGGGTTRRDETAHASRPVHPPRGLGCTSRMHSNGALADHGVSAAVSAEGSAGSARPAGRSRGRRTPDRSAAARP